MRDRDIVQLAFDEYCETLGCAKKSGSWYLRGPDVIVVLNLQKSNFATRYFVNVALWLLALGDADAPKENKCHVRTRLSQLVPPEVEAQVNDLLDLERDLDDGDRRSRLLRLLREQLSPLIGGSSNLEGLRSGAGRRMIERSLVSAPAQKLLQG